MNHFKEHRIGKFKVSREFIRNGDTKKLLDFFGNFIIIDIAHNYAYEHSDYVAYSLLFDSVPEGEVAPEYVIEMHEHSDGKITYRAIRQKEPFCDFCHAVRSLKPRKDKGRYKMWEPLFVCEECGFYQ
jgi:hypothetical protein